MGFFLLLFCFAGAAGQEQLLEEANKHYTSQEYEQAVAKYEQILASGKESAELYYNLGNAWFKLGENTKAILCYERAKLLAPQNDDIEFNLQIANQMVVDHIEELPRPFFSRWGSALAGLTSETGWARLSVISFVLFLILLGSYLFGRTILVRKGAFFMALGAILFAILSFSMAYRHHSLQKNRQGAIIQCPRVTLKSSPSETGTDLYLIHEGLKVEITDSLDSWKEIRLLDGNKGWLRDSCLVNI